jgi:low affinity Fe/Cu permease
MNRKLLVVEDERLLLMATADLVEAALQSPQGAQRAETCVCPIIQRQSTSKAAEGCVSGPAGKYPIHLHQVSETGTGRTSARYHRAGQDRTREVHMSGSTSKFFSKFATNIADLSGKPATFVTAVALVLVWAASGPFFGYSETWQLVINTSTTIVTFLMVFVLQNSQNRDGKALQAKLDELILTSQAQNKFVGIEKLDEQELRDMSKTLAEKAACVEDVADEKAEKSAGAQASA